MNEIETSCLNVVVLFSNYGPYHISRVESFANIFPGRVIPVQLYRKEKIREWKPGESKIQILTAEEMHTDKSQACELGSKLISILEDINPDVIVIAGYGHPEMRSIARWALKKDVVSIMLSDSHYLDKPRIWFIEKLKGWWIRKHFDAAFVSGSRAAAYLESLGFPRKYIWLGYDVVDNEYFTCHAREVRKNESGFRGNLNFLGKYFLYVGRFSPEKNLISLLKAYKKYRDIAGERSWKLVMVGNGPLERALKESASKLGLNSVIWAGFKHIDDLPSYYALASCFILPSKSEPWGLVVNEAMASGLPVLVSARCGCTPDLVFPGINGYVFEGNDVNELCYLMNRISSGEVNTEKMGKASSEIIANYTPEAWARALADCITISMQRIRNHD
ncbi:MAG: glycosyltransferase family 4 protein [Thermodesulfobacteriota bacterium]